MISTSQRSNKNRLKGFHITFSNPKVSDSDKVVFLCKYCNGKCLKNGTETSYSYEADRRRLQNMQVTSPFNQSTLIDNSYLYDKLSNVLSVSNTATPKPGQLGGSSQNNYQYDILNRLVSATGSFSGIDESANYSLNMQYDDLHNIQNKSVSQTSSINAGSSYNNAYQYSKTPHAPTKVGEDLFSYDANGNQTLHQKANGSFLQYKWDEENRLMASDNFGLVAQYTYDASGERVIKSSAENQKTIFINGAPAGYTYHNENYTAYVGGHFEVKEGRFTKHYFNGAERLASKIGVGTLDNSAAKGYYQAGGIDYGKRYADAYKDFKQIAKEQGLPPGPPNLKFIYAQQALADERANSELVAELTLLNQLSLDEWMEINSDKDPGPPICQPPFCVTGGDINSPTLPENDIYFFHPDHLGSTSYITNIAGETVQFNSYLPFGESFVSQQRTSIVSVYTFLSKEKDRESGNHYLSARYYNSELSIFLTIDPLWEQTGDPYGYSYRNPIRFIDPNGMKADDWVEDKNGNIYWDEKATKQTEAMTKAGETYLGKSTARCSGNSCYNFQENGTIDMNTYNSESKTSSSKILKHGASTTTNYGEKYTSKSNFIDDGVNWALENMASPVLEYGSLVALSLTIAPVDFVAYQLNGGNHIIDESLIKVPAFREGGQLQFLSDYSDKDAAKATVGTMSNFIPAAKITKSKFINNNIIGNIQNTAIGKYASDFIEKNLNKKTK